MLINQIPLYLHDVKEFQGLTAALDDRNDLIEKAIDGLSDDQYISTATEGGLLRYESMLGIATKETHTVEERRFKLHTVYNQQVPYTETKLHKLLESSVGSGAYDLVIDRQTMTVYVKLGLAQKNMYDAIVEMIDKVVPLNMRVDITLMYNTYSQYNDICTHDDLAKYTHAQLREEILEYGRRNQTL